MPKVPFLISCEEWTGPWIPFLSLSCFPSFFFMNDKPQELPRKEGMRSRVSDYYRSENTFIQSSHVTDIFTG